MRERRSASALWPSRSTSRSRGLVHVLVRVFVVVVFVFVFVVVVFVVVFGGEADSRRAVPGGMFGARGRDRAS
ncbi:hypothetical protein [Curtobacterium flaccumfaciens]|uniref:hypothetical protein n=1 Tax=Curtobacterium flaccumfaciens TaxID=2035 RepID=UPI00265B3594|nr:hypothetical protein [Curtobacterium flaccumfaciens]MCS5506899.1 hypothetical protein [Curtobacterium flaccumfaciens pv. flaccumfaciens]